MRQFARVFGVVSFVTLAGTSALLASDIHVPADYSTIQAAIDAATTGDVVLVSPGTYYENIDFKGKAITVQSTDGWKTTTINGSLSGSCVRFASGEGNASVLRAFTLTNGGVPGYTGYLGGGVHVENAAPTIEDNVIVGNMAQNGGGISNVNSLAVIQRNFVLLNVATGDGGGINVDSGSAPTLIDNLIFNNSSHGAGGGVQCYSSTPLLVNNTIVSNSAGTNGGGILCWQATATVVNSIAWGNTPNQFGQDPGGSVIATFSDVEGGWSGTGNIDVDPMFDNGIGGLYHLTPGSPCINAGDNSASSLPTTDIDGDPRIIDGTVDIGADEAVLSPTVLAVTPARTKYDAPVSVTIAGAGFSAGTGTTVTIGNNSASNVVVVDDQTVTCDFPVGTPGTADVTVSNSLGSGTLSAGFTYTPAITIDGTPQLGAAITIHYLCDPGDGLLGIYGLPPEVSIPTPPYFGDLCIVPFDVLLILPTWPFQNFDVQATIPNDPSLSGVQILLQALIGPSLTGKAKDGAWTNCAVLAIQ